VSRYTAGTNVPLEVRAPLLHPEGVTLASAPLGVPLVIGAAALPSPRRLRLAELGLRPGATVTLLRRTAGGGRIVGVGDARVAVGRSVLLQVPAVLTPRIAENN
jgi:ferrous iron transport protein A